MIGTDAPPIRRWHVVAASALILALAMGTVVNGMSAYVVPLEAARGWARADAALVNTAGILGLALGGIAMGRLADRHGARPVVLFGAVVLGACHLLAAATTAAWQLTGLMFVAGLLGAAAIFAPVIALVGRWFPAGAGLAIGVFSAGQALGQGGVPFLSALLIERWGVSATLAVTGAAMLVVLVPLASLLRQPPRPGSDRTPGAPSNGYPPFGLVVPTLCVAILLCCTCMSVPLMHLVPLIQDRGFAPDEAGGVMFAMLLVAVAGRVAFGQLADRIGALPAYMTATAWMTALVWGFARLDGLDGFTAYAVVYGFGYAGVMTGVLVSIGALTAPERRGAAIGIVTMFGWFGHAAGGYLGGLTHDLTGGYDLAFGLAAASGLANLLVVGTLFTWLRRRRSQWEATDAAPA